MATHWSDAALVVSATALIVFGAVVVAGPRPLRQPTEQPHHARTARMSIGEAQAMSSVILGRLDQCYGDDRGWECRPCSKTATVSNGSCSDPTPEAENLHQFVACWGGSCELVRVR